MTMLNTTEVVAALGGGPKVDRASRVAQLEKQLERVRKDITEQERLDKRWALVEGAFNKLMREMGKTLTHEEWEAIDGAYIFLHSGKVDLVRQIPSATSKGEDRRLEKDLNTAEAMRELQAIGGKHNAR